MRMEKSADAFRTISEVAEDLDLPQHVLRFWETRFAQIKPLKRAGGRRFYRPDDIELLRAIQKLLYGEGYTIKGVQKLLKDQGVHAVVAVSRTERGGYQGTDAQLRHAHAERPPLNKALFDETDEPGAPPAPAETRNKPNAIAAEMASYPDTECDAPLDGDTTASNRAPMSRAPMSNETFAVMEKLLSELLECQRILEIGRRG